MSSIEREGTSMTGFAQIIVNGVARELALERNADPDDAQIRSALAGNICRCCTYPRILRAVRRATELARDADGWTRPEPITAGVSLLTGSARPRRPWDLTSPEQRDYFEMLPDGLVVVLEPGQTRDPGSWVTSAGAWIHVGAGGTVTAFTGKVDIVGSALARRTKARPELAS